jgi:hypothetical protein
MKNLRLKKVFICSVVIVASLQLNAQLISITPTNASIENTKVKIEFNLETGAYSGIDKTENTVMFKDARFMLDRGLRMWDIPKQRIKAEEITGTEGRLLRVWYIPDYGYDPPCFLDVALGENASHVIIGWGVKNKFEYEIRVRQADVLFQGLLFEDQEINNPKVLRGGAGAEPNFVEDTWEIDALNSAMLTYNSALNRKRKTLVVGGLKYKEFYRQIEIYEGEKSGKDKKEKEYSEKQPFINITVTDPQGKRVPPKAEWKSADNIYLDFTTKNPFESLELYGRELAKANDANPNVYNFPTLCGWMVSTEHLGEGKPINHSPGLVEQMELARKRGLNKYTSLAVRLEPDYYCYEDQGNTQQGWWDDEHWAKYGSLKAPYETFSKFSSEIMKKGGQVFTYFQASMPSNDFAVAHPEWMLNDDISLIHTDHPHHKPLVRYDYTNADFQKYLLDMWTRLRNDGVIGIKFDYPETAWAWHGGFDDKSYTTTSAYKKVFELCRQGMGEEALIHERIIGNKVHEDVPRLDCTIGAVDLQRIWSDASHFEPEMASRMGLRWYKQGIAFRYYPDGKSFYNKGEALSAKDRRTFLTLVGLLSGRIELGTSIGSMTDEMFFDLTRLYPVLKNGQSFRPVDFLLGKKHPEVYVYDVNSEWKQVILINNNTETAKTIVAPISGDQTTTGAIGFNPDNKYIVYDFWNEKPLEIYDGAAKLSRKLDKSEALVYAIKELKTHPQIIGTNRHVMCGMFEIKNETWNVSNRILAFNADLVAGETMKIFIHVPEQLNLTVSEILADNTNSSYSTDGNYLILSLLNENKNGEAAVKVKF